MAWSLSRQSRFIGHQRDPNDDDSFYNNAQHSMVVSQICELFAKANPNLSKWQTDLYTPKVFGLLGLFHDGTEAYLSDIFGPSKKVFKSYLKAEAILHSCIHRKFGLPPVMPLLVKTADKAALVLEFYKYQRTLPINFDYPEDEVARMALASKDFLIPTTMKPGKAYHAFLERYLELQE